MPAGQGKDAERFAAAVESGTPLGPADDADLARDLEIVAMLRSRGGAYAPDPDAKARAKQRLMAALAADQPGPRHARHEAEPPAAAELTAPLGRPVERADVDPTAETTVMRPVADADPDAEAGESGTLVEPIPLHGDRPGRKARHTLGGRAGRRSGRRESGRGLPRRFVLVSSAAAVTAIALAGGGVLASGSSLPGDTLYPVKRVAESAGLALTFDEEGRARRHLEIAATRLSEVERLAREAEAPPSPEVFTSAMDDFDSATNEGSQLLLNAAQSEREGAAAEDLHKWASEQSDRLAELEPTLPEAADADTSRELLERLLGQTQRLEADEKCEQGDCDSRRTSGESTAESEPGEDGDEDTTKTPDADSSKSSEADRPSRTPSSTDREDPRLLPDLLPDANKDDDEKSSTKSSEKEEDSSSSSKPDSDEDESEGGGNVSVPLPLLPPVTLPPLLPGMPGITIG